MMKYRSIKIHSKNHNLRKNNNKINQMEWRIKNYKRFKRTIINNNNHQYDKRINRLISNYLINI